MTDVGLSRLATTVLWAAFGLAVVFVAIAQRTRFCTMGAIADVVYMGDWTRARMWALAVLLAIVGGAVLALRYQVWRMDSMT